MQIVPSVVSIKIGQQYIENVKKGNKVEHKAGKEEQRRDGKKQNQNSKVKDLSPNRPVILSVKYIPHIVVKVNLLNT